MQDSINQRVGTFPSQKNQRRKGSRSSDENTNTRRVKLQTSFPPIHLSLISNSKSLDKKYKDHGSIVDVSRDIRGEKINLPQVEKPTEKFPKSVKSFPDRTKYAKDYGCNISSLSSTPTCTYDGQKDARVEMQPWLDVPMTKSTSDRLSPEIAKVPECPSCRNERRIRSDYDKILLQSRRDKEALQQRVSELEAELKKCEDVNKLVKRAEDDVVIYPEQEHRSEVVPHLGSLESTYKNKLPCKIRWEHQRKLEEENKDKQEQIEKILMQLENTNAELEKFKKTRSLLIAELCKEKDYCLMEIEKCKAFIEKLKAENTSLSDTITLLQQDLEKRSLCSCRFTPQVYSAGTEVLLISHGPSPENAHSPAVGPDFKYQELCSGGRTLQNFSSSSNQSAMTHAEEDEVRIKELYKQLKRERNLLLDVMTIMYTRRWFMEEAIPHVKRTLRKCGVFSENTC
ncbi:uncharacterized protein LOC142492924 [Ascaphus truei]|uniref:uncharacterized protein LOC142492924 n=1 Tax=Ascaphus truei TaxID=8439 RepID=UPI003F5A176D